MYNPNRKPERTESKYKIKIIPIVSLGYSSILKMEVIYYSEISLDFHGIILMLLSAVTSQKI
jgi:hypothetical protein